MIDLNAVPRRAGDLRHRRVEEEAIILRQEAGEVLVLDEVGARCFELVDGARTLGEVLDLIEGEYDVERATLEADVERFLVELVEAGLIVLEG